MVFGWGKKKTINDVEPTKKEKQITVSEINVLLKENEEQLTKKIMEQAKSIKEQIDTERKNILETILQFNEDDLNAEDVDKSLKILIERGKKTVVPGLKRETAVNLSNPDNYANLVNLNIQTAQMLKRIGDILGLNSRVLHVFARKYTDKLKAELASMTNNKGQLQILVNEYDNFQSVSKNILDDVEKTREIKIKIENKKHELADIHEQIKKNKTIINGLEHEIENLKSKKEYHEFINYKKEIEKLIPEKNGIKKEIDVQFSKISRPLGKYSYISSLEKHLKGILDRLVIEPSEVITSENKNAIIEVLEATVKSVVTGNVSVKDSQKAVEQIEETIDRLDEFLRQINNLAKKTDDLKRKLAIFNINDLEEMEKRLAKTQEEITQFESSAKALEKEIFEESKHVPNLISNIEKEVGEISKTRITLKI